MDGSPRVDGVPGAGSTARLVRVVAFGSWAFGWLLFGTACWLREPALFAGFAACYLLLAPIAVFASRRAAGNRWALVEHFRELSHRDDLTGLHNRRHFRLALEAEVAAARESGVALSVALVDLNDFKGINDSFGHPAGDRALCAAGQAILSASPAGATVARIGGDEFALIMPGIALAQAERVVAAIHRAIESARFLGDAPAGGRASMRATIGMAQLERDWDAPALVRQVDAALYAAKGSRRAA